MGTVTKLIIDRLKADTGPGSLATLLDQYDGELAAFSDPQVPENAPEKYVWLLGTDNEDPSDTKLSLGRRINRTIWCRAKNTGSWAVVEDIADRVVDLFHRKPLTGGTVPKHITGWKCNVTGPISIDSEDESIVCLAVTLDLEFTKL